MSSSSPGNSTSTSASSSRAYLEAIDQAERPRRRRARSGVWISGFFGSGKSHFLKVLSYLLRNRTHSLRRPEQAGGRVLREQDQGRHALRGHQAGRRRRNTDVILFNIDSKADQPRGPGRHPARLPQGPQRVAGLQRRPPAHRPHGAVPRRQGQARGSSTPPIEKPPAREWVQERDAYQFNRDEVVKALAETLGQSQDAAEKWIDGAESNFSLTVENFCKWVKEYLDSKGPEHRLVFLVDEVGQFIGTDSHLMLNLQTITEDLGTICGGRAWVVVTSQEDIDAVLGEMKKTKTQRLLEDPGPLQDPPVPLQRQRG